jgi:hypothetical protein
MTLLGYFLENIDASQIKDFLNVKYAILPPVSDAMLDAPCHNDTDCQISQNNSVCMQVGKSQLYNNQQFYHPITR